MLGLHHLEAEEHPAVHGIAGVGSHTAAKAGRRRDWRSAVGLVDRVAVDRTVQAVAGHIDQAVAGRIDRTAVARTDRVGDRTALIGLAVHTAVTAVEDQEAGHTGRIAA
jgi:hypothetical protein